MCGSISSASRGVIPKEGASKYFNIIYDWNGPYIVWDFPAISDQRFGLQLFVTQERDAAFTVAKSLPKLLRTSAFGNRPAMLMMAISVGLQLIGSSMLYPLGVDPVVVEIIS